MNGESRDQSDPSLRTLAAMGELPHVEGVEFVDAEPIVGSVQVLYPVRYGGNKEGFISRATDAGSVFDIGSFFEIPGSGESRNTLRHQIYTGLENPRTWLDLSRQDFEDCFTDPELIDRLLMAAHHGVPSKHGIRTHHVGIVDSSTGIVVGIEEEVRSDLVLIERFPVIKPLPVKLQGETVYDYSEYFRHDFRVMALEHILRLGSPAGSSLQDRYEKLAAQGDEEGARKLLAPFGVKPPLRAWSRLPNAVLDWTTKYEDQDRPLTKQEVLNLSGLSGVGIQQLADDLMLCTVYASKFFRQRGLRLWDLKWEVANAGVLPSPVIVDTLDQDSVRITVEVEHDQQGNRCHVHFNKQAMRDYFRIFHPDWHAALNDAKARSKQPGATGTWQDIYHAGVAADEYPPMPELDPAFAELQAHKYALVSETNPSPEAAAQLGLLEVHYYRSHGKLAEFLEQHQVAA